MKYSVQTTHIPAWRDARREANELWPPGDYSRVLFLELGEFCADSHALFVFKLVPVQTARKTCRFFAKCRVICAARASPPFVALFQLLPVGRGK